VLGAAAFLIAEFLKISYLDVIWMATIPTLLYYTSLLFMVELDARRFGAKVVPSDTTLSLWEMTKRYGFHFTSLIAVIVFMIAGYSPMLSVFYSTLMCFVLSGLTPETALAPRPLLLILAVVGVPLYFVTDLWHPILFFIALVGVIVMSRRSPEAAATSRKLVRTLADGSIGVLNAATTCASAGIIVGVVTLTGLGLKFSSIVLDYAGGSLLVTAIYTALIVWIVGLAVPVTASYIICAVITAPALTKLGVPDFAAHMFIFYYAVLSEVSPPTALSPFAASAITGGDPYRTTLQAWKYTLPAFLVPFVFVLDPIGVGLLMKIPKDGSIADIVIISLKTAAGLAALAAGAQNWMLHRTTMAERVLLILAGLLLVFPSLIEAAAEGLSGYDLPLPAPFGLAIMAILLARQWITRAKPAKA
jgi:TRAP transporter 4TM/12TM fusion protein